MHKLPTLIVFGLAAAVFCLPAAAADERDKARAGAGASSEGGVNLGGTGIDSGVANPRGTDETDKRIKLQRKPKPAEGLKEPERRIPVDKGASAGSTQPRGSLSEEADQQDEEFRKKERQQRRK